MPFRRLGTISSDPATVSPWIRGQTHGSVAGFSAPSPTQAAAEADLGPQHASNADLSAACGAQVETVTVATPQAAATPIASADPGPSSAPGPAADRFRNGPAGPSFLIRGSQASQPAAGSSAGSGWSTGQPRLDRVNSVELLRQAREAYFIWLSHGASASEPLGIVLNGSGGRVVFELPVLLPAELFVPIEWLRPRSGGRSRAGRSGAAPRPPF